MGIGVFIEDSEFMPAFAESEKYGEKKCRDKQPKRNININSKCTGDRTKHKTDGNNHDIENDNALEIQRIEKLHDKVSDNDPSKADIKKKSANSSDDKKNDAPSKGMGRGEFS